MPYVVKMGERYLRGRGYDDWTLEIERARVFEQKNHASNSAGRNRLANGVRVVEVEIREKH